MSSHESFLNAIREESLENKKNNKELAVASYIVIEKVVDLN